MIYKIKLQQKIYISRSYQFPIISIVFILFEIRGNWFGKINNYSIKVSSPLKLTCG